MSQKKFHAYIDNQEIVIISSDGCNLEKEITNKEVIQFRVKALIGFLGLVGFSALSMMASQVFFTKFTEPQNIVMGFIVFGSGMSIGGLVEYLTQSLKESKLLRESFNLAKRDLQADIMNLERVLIQHQSSLKEINLKDKFVFSNKFKKSELEKEA
jgi:hypothetical protein